MAEGQDIINSTFTKLSESLIQQAALSINSIQVPEFKGLPDEDIHDFISDFELSTLALSSEHRCLAINKSLKDAALIWAKSTIKELLTEGDWDQIKKLLIDRFGPADRKLHYKEKLSQMKYESGKTTLIAYVELFLSNYKKAYVKYSPNDSIHALRCNLPDRIIKGLNSLDDTWTSMEDEGKFTNLVQRFENNILVFEKKDEIPSPTLNVDVIKNMFEEFKAELIKDQKKTEEQKKENQGLSVIKHQTPSKSVQESKYQYGQPRQQSNYNRFNFKKRYNSDKPMNHTYKQVRFEDNQFRRRESEYKLG